MVVKGFQKVSLIDYPGKIAAVLFTAGCNFRCPYCYNRDLVLNPESLQTISEEEVLAYLKKRKRLVDGVVITGGEPTLQKDLPQFARKIKELGLLVKLDTNGANTSALHSAVVNGLVDYVALDVKAPLDDRYARAIGLDQRKSARNQRQSAETSKLDDILRSLKQSLEILQDSKVNYELRTTVVPTLHSEDNLLDLAKQLKELLASHVSPPTSPIWFLQNFQPKNCLDPEFEKIRPYDNIFFENLVEKLKVDMPFVQVRG